MEPIAINVPMTGERGKRLHALCQETIDFISDRTADPIEIFIVLNYLKVSLEKSMGVKLTEVVIMPNGSNQ